MDRVLVKRAGNRALQVNPPNGDIHLGRWGSDWGWTVFCIMGASTLGLLIWSTVVPRNRRTFHYLLTAVLAISTIAWYSMASDLGSTPITVQFLRNSPLGGGFGGYPTRQIWYARYIDWTLSTPLILLSLLLITGLPLSIIFITLFFNVLMIICGLLGALTRTRYKWGYFVSVAKLQRKAIRGSGQVADTSRTLHCSAGLCMRRTGLRPVSGFCLGFALISSTQQRIRTNFSCWLDSARRHLAFVSHLLGTERRRQRDRC